MGTWSTGHSLYTVQQAGGCLLQGLQLSKPLAASSSGFCFFQAAALKSESPCSVTSMRDSFAAFTGCPGREGPGESGWLQELPEAIMSCLASLLRSFPEGLNVSILQNLHNTQSLSQALTFFSPLLPQ